jgi:WD40 repeat protein
MVGHKMEITSLTFIGRKKEQLVSGADKEGHLYIWNTKTNTMIGRFNCPGTIIDVQQNRHKQLIITSNEGLYVINKYNNLDAITAIHKCKEW